MNPQANQKTKTPRSLLALLGVALCFGCSKEEYRTVDAQVFITVEGGSNIRLGNVPFMCVPEESFSEMLSVFNKFNQISTDKFPELQAEIDSDWEKGALLKAARDIDWYLDLREFGMHEKLIKRGEEAGIIKHRSDADGRVQLYAPSSGKEKCYWFALTERKLANGRIEKYAWMVEMDKNTNRKFVFSNHNIWDVDVQAAKFGMTPPPKLNRQRLDYPR